MNIKTPDGQEIDFWSDPQLPPDPKNIAIQMSGGMDSTALLFLTLEKFPTIEIFPLVGEDKNRASNVEVVNHILTLARERYPQSVVHDPFITHYEKVPNKKVDKVNNKEFFKTIDDSCCVVLSGRTCNPPHINMGRKIDSISSVDVYHKNKTIINYRPFANVDKRVPLQIYKDLDIVNVIDHTVSCVNILDSGSVPCNDCLWCDERKWVMEFL